MGRGSMLKKDSIYERRFKLQQYQSDFVFSKSKFPAMHAAWGTGKTLCGILRAMLYSDLIPNNHGLICRKEYNDLADSTIRDFEDYTHIKVNSKRNAILSNGSVIMFRHLEELVSSDLKGQNNLQNINLGWFMIEQAEELLSDRAFFLLFGRMRRKVIPSDAFNRLGLPTRSGFCIANVNGEDWNYKLWCQNPGKDFHLIEACTQDNAENLPQDFLDSLNILKEKKPQVYARFVLNDRSAETDLKVFRDFRRLRKGGFEAYDPDHEYIGAVDFAKKKDYAAVCVIDRDTNKAVYMTRWNKKTVATGKATYWKYCKEKVKAINARFGSKVFWFMDATGVGDPVVEDLIRDGLDVYCDKEKETNGVVVTNNLKEQMVERTQIAIDETMISYPDPEECEGKEREVIEAFESEMQSFQQEVTLSRNIRYNAPTGEHDDLVFVFILAVWAMFGDMYVEFTEKEEKTEQEEFWDRVRLDTAKQMAKEADDDIEQEITHVGETFIGE